MKNKVDAIKFSNGPNGNQYVVVFSTDVMKGVVAGNANALELLQRSLKNVEKDEWRAFGSDEELTDVVPVKQLTDDSQSQVVDLDTATITVEETEPQLTY